MAQIVHRRAVSRLVAALCLVSAIALSAQQDERARTLDERLHRIFETRDFSVPTFGPARWLDKGNAYTTVEPAAPPANGSDIVRYDGRTGARDVLVPATQLTPPGASTALDIADYVWSADGRRLLVFTNTERVWRQNTRGDYWVLDRDTGRLRKLGGNAPASALMFAKFSPDASRVAYVRGNNLYVERVDDGRIIQLTRDGSETTINGTSDWVYEEELGVRDGFRWSPDGRRIAYWQFDSTGVGVFSLINDTDALYPRITRIPYPKVGTTNSAARIGVIDANGGKTVWMMTPGDPRETYLATLDWVDVGTVAMQQLNRLQNRNDFLLGDARSGAVKSAFRDESKAWVDVIDDVRWLDDHRSFLWISERDGWRHVFRVSRDNGSATLITRFDADVTDVAGLDESGRWLYFRASPDNATQRYLYRSRVDGTGTPERVSPQGQPGTHAYNVSPNGRLALHTYSRFDIPPSTDVVTLPDHRSERTLTPTATLIAALAPVMVPPVEFFTIDIGNGIALDGWMLKPASFDPARRYPAIVFVYGEPADQTVVDRWGGNRMLFHRALAEAGYIVLSVDNRGTPAPKGVAWRKIVYGSVGDLSSREQAEAVKAFAATHAFIDPGRIGIWGWSGGGTSTLNAMFRFADVYSVGVAVAPVPDQTLYDTIYQERYMGLPKDNADGYHRGSPIYYAAGLKGKLLVIHGSGDDNVHFQGHRAADQSPRGVRQAI
jgi:dipeptidyl-peptidase-4